MNRKWTGLIWVAVLLAVGLAIGYQFKDSPPQETNRTFVDSAARRKISASLLALELPSHAADVAFREESADSRSRRSFIAFTLPADLFDDTMRQSRLLPQPDQFKPDSALLSTILAMCDPMIRPWWRPDQMTHPLSAQASGTLDIRPAPLRWRTQVAVASEGESDASHAMRRVFAVLIEMPAGADPQPEPAVGR